MNKSIIGGGGAKTQARIAAHVHAWEQIKGVYPQYRHGRLPFITISAQFGCEAQALAEHLAALLNERCRPRIPWVSYDRELLDLVAEEMHLARNIVESLDGKRRDEMSELFNAILNTKLDEALIFRKMAEVMRSLAAHGNAILIGRGGYLITQDMKTGLHIRLIAPRSWRVQKTAELRGISYKEAEHAVEIGDHDRARFFHAFFVQKPDLDCFHDLTIDSSRFNLAQEAEIVFTALGARFGEVLVGE